MISTRPTSHLPRRLTVALATGVLLAACANGTPGSNEDGGSEEPTSSVEAPSSDSEQTPPTDEQAADDEPTPVEGEDEDAGEGDGDGEDPLEGDLPPVDPLALEPLYGDVLADAGVELTTQGGLIDRTDGYEVSADGTHLALYVAPIGERTDDEYVDGIVGLARIFLTDVFDRWPGLESFDICQELPEDEVEEGHIATVTQIDISRRAASTVDWEDVTLIDLYAMAEDDDEVTVRAIGDIRSHPRLLEARQEAGAEARSG